MQSIPQGIPNPYGYIKCGEILKSENSVHDPYILRCIQCKEMYLLLESFIFHLDETCKKSAAKAKKKRKRVRREMDSSINYEEDEVLNEPLNDELPVKLENTNAQMLDPLIVVKKESDVEKFIIKIEPSCIDETKNFEFESSTQFQIDQVNEEELNEEDSESFNSQEECESQESEPEEVIIQKPSNTNDETLSFVSNFMKSEENVNLLIAAFKDQPQLWNKTMTYYGNKLKRREFMIKIAEDLNSNHKININGNQVSAVSDHLYRKYHEDLHRAQEKDDGKKQIYVKPWYLSQLDFIKPYLENFSLEVLAPNQANLSAEQILQILDIYRCLPHLWNSNLIENHCKNKRHESILEMLKQIETKINFKINANELEQYLLTIHNYFSSEKRRILNDITSSKTDNDEQPNNKYYNSLMFLYDHVAPLRCSICGGESISPLHFKIHTSTHDGTMPFTCSQCNKTFKQINIYVSHAKRHSQDLNYMCKECGKKFANCTNLRLHMRIHTGDRPYCCEICGDSFRFLQALSTHRRRHEKRYLYTCKICSHGFYSKMHHDDHMNSHMNIRSHICNICNKTFITKRALKTHSVVHEDARNYACKLCDKTFKHQTGVYQHMKTHDVVTAGERSDV